MPVTVCDVDPPDELEDPLVDEEVLPSPPPPPHAASAATRERAASDLVMQIVWLVFRILLLQLSFGERRPLWVFMISS